MSSSVPAVCALLLVALVATSRAHEQVTWDDASTTSSSSCTIDYDTFYPLIAEFQDCPSVVKEMNITLTDLYQICTDTTTSPCGYSDAVSLLAEIQYASSCGVEGLELYSQLVGNVVDILNVLCTPTTSCWDPLTSLLEVSSALAARSLNASAANTALTSTCGASSSCIDAFYTAGLQVGVTYGKPFLAAALLCTELDGHYCATDLTPENYYTHICSSCAKDLYSTASMMKLTDFTGLFPDMTHACQKNSAGQYCAYVVAAAEETAKVSKYCNSTTSVSADCVSAISQFKTLTGCCQKSALAFPGTSALAYFLTDDYCTSTASRFTIAFTLSNVNYTAVVALSSSLLPSLKSEIASMLSLVSSDIKSINFTLVSTRTEKVQLLVDIKPSVTTYDSSSISTELGNMKSVSFSTLNNAASTIALDTTQSIGVSATVKSTTGASSSSSSSSHFSASSVALPAAIFSFAAALFAL